MRVIVHTFHACQQLFRKCCETNCWSIESTYIIYMYICYILVVALAQREGFLPLGESVIQLLFIEKKKKINKYTKKEHGENEINQSRWRSKEFK